VYTKLVNDKIIVHSLFATLIAIGIVYCLVAYSEYEDFKELSDMGITGETAEKQFEASFFAVIAVVNFGLGLWVLKSKRSVMPYIFSGAVSGGLIMIYVASRTVGVPIVGVEYYIGRLDIISKVLQLVAIVLSTVAVYRISNSKIVKKLAR
jgi:hypothetical protein